MTRKVLLLSAMLLLLLLLQQDAPRCYVLGDTNTDAQCLQQFKTSVNDPLGLLTFFGVTLDYCNLHGLSCLHGVLVEISVANSSLSGPFPDVRMCTSLNKLDLSNNDFSGPISSTLCTDAPQLVTIDLGYNQFSGPVPENLATCYYLNDLYVQDNDLCGPLPVDINNSTQPRLKQFVTYGNDLDTNCGSNTESALIATRRRNTGMIVGAAIGALGVILLVSIGVLVYWWVHSKRPPAEKASRWKEDDWIKRIRSPNYIIVSMFEKPLVKLSLSDLMAATNEFSQANLISSSKSGSVYKGTVRDGTVMAIKRLGGTDRTNKEFRAEMETLGKLKHRNLVPLLGYCIAGKERILVYKHMPGGTIQDLIKGSRSVKDGARKGLAIDSDADIEKGLHSGSEMMERASLDWKTRLKLGIGTARGLAWLHHSCNPRVLHRNISSSNILLDHELEPKISNFGLARLMNPLDTHVSTFVNGDYGQAGYVAPEYARTLVATVKGDVFSFGVVMLELISGQKATEVRSRKFKGNLAAWVWALYNSGRVEDAIDKSFIDGSRDDELIQFLKLAVSCVHPVPKERPSMYEIYHMLRAIGEKYHLTDENDDIPLASSTY